MDCIAKMIDATEDLDVILWEDEKGSGHLVSIKHKVRISNTNNEVLVRTSDIPDLVKALTDAALEQAVKAYYARGYKDGLFQGWDKKSEDFDGHLKHYLATGGTIETLLATAKQIQQKLD